MKPFVLTAILGLIVGCSDLNNQSNSSTKCTDRVAQIVVSEGVMTRVCGCSEPGNQVFTAGLSLTCTVPVGTQVFFIFSNIQNQAQMTIPRVGSTFVFSPNSSSPTEAMLILSNTGTYEFFNAFLPTLRGQFIVQ